MKIQHIIGDGESNSLDGRTYDDVDPYTLQSYADVALGGADDVTRAVAVARQAFDEGPWPRMGFAERARLMHKLADLLETHADELASAESRDMGKPLSVARENDVPRAIHNLRFFADHASLSTSEVYPSDAGFHTYARYEPAGVVGAISPWNFPLLLETWKIAPALAWGNTVVLKPAEDTPHSAAILGRLALEAGLPAGVLNVVLGDGTAGQILTADPRVDRITFTGSSATGKAIAAAVAPNLTPASFELGGKGANLIFDDADLTNAVQWSLRAAFSNAGQVCLAGSRLYVQRGIYAEFLEAFTTGAEAMKLGDPRIEGTAIGPLASRKHYEKVAGYLQPSALAGGTIATGGLADGWFVRPTVLVDVPATAPVQKDEVFGPVVTVTAFDTEDEVVGFANDTPYGLSAMVFTENLNRGHRVAGRLKSGNVWVNCFFVRDLRTPFGGMGASGVGREGGVFSRDFFTEPKTVCMQVSQ